MELATITPINQDRTDRTLPDFITYAREVLARPLLEATPQGQPLGRFAMDDPVSVRWTNNFHYYIATGRVHKINNKTIRVHLTHPVKCGVSTTPYPAGRSIIAPLPNNFDEWSVNNGVFGPIAWDVRIGNTPVRVTALSNYDAKILAVRAMSDNLEPSDEQLLELWGWMNSPADEIKALAVPATE